MQCPPSPLLFDSSGALEDQAIKDIAEAAVDILAREEPPQPGIPTQATQLDRGSSSGQATLPTMESHAEPPAQVEPGMRLGLPAMKQ